MVKLKLFGTSGVRGEININLTPELAVKLSLAFSNFLGNFGTIAIGRDVRIQSKVLAKACISGAISGGLNVINVGVVPTPALLHIVKELKLNGAIMVTASHIPPKYAGILFFLGDTAELTPDEHKILERMILENKFKHCSWSEIGKVEYFDGSLDIYLKAIIRQVNVRKIRSFGAKVLIDPSNSAQSLFLVEIANEFGCKIFTLNDFPCEYFPGRGPDLHPRTLKFTSNYCKTLNVDFGIATDGDGDRCLFIDSNGKVLWGDTSGCIFAFRELSRLKGGIIVCPVNTSNLIFHVAKLCNGSVHLTKVGPPAIIGAVKKLGNVIFAFEESGKYIWPDNVLYGDPALALGKMIEILSERSVSLSNLVSSFPKYYRVKVAVDCPENIKLKVLNEVKKRINELNPVKIIDIDGLKLIFKDDSWLLFRPSGTEPVFRVFSESKDKILAEKLANLGVKLIKNIVSKFI